MTPQELRSKSDPAVALGEQDINRLLGAARREIKVHCYRMLGSLHEAEDAVQEAFVRAWRSHATFDGHGTFRAWLYRIATNVCLDALSRRRHQARILPDQHEPATTDMPGGQPAADVAWLEPYPQTELDAIVDPGPTPEARFSLRQATRLAFVAAIQQLAPRQRASLLLCDVLGWSVAETASLLGGTVASINSALQRARAKLSRERESGERSALTEATPSEQRLLRAYLQAWEARDADQLASLLKADAIYTMPPLTQWYAGPEAIRAFFAWAWPRYWGIRMQAIQANGEPAFAAYFRSRSAPGAPWAAHSLHVLSLDDAGIARITLFVGPNVTRLFEAFDLPASLADDSVATDAPR
jgi:RNA polymerase sigma-70 factor (ECF subfamily)